MPEPNSPFYPPRASWYAPIRAAGHAALAATRVTKLPTPDRIGVGRFLLGLFIPGFAFVIHRRPRIGLALVATWPILFTLGLAFLGENAGNLFIGLAISLHATSIVHLIGPWLRDLRVHLRILASLMVVLGFIVFVYLPIQELAYHKLFVPIVTEQGSVIVRPSRTPAGVHRGDWLAYWMPRYHADAVIIPEGLSFGSVVALAGETVEFTPAFVRVNGRAYPRQEGMPQDLSVSVPEGHWFIWPRFAQVENRGNIHADTIRAAMIDRALVPQKNLRGRPFSRWFHRQQVLTTP